jgi:hypothetical protein
VEVVEPEVPGAAAVGVQILSPEVMAVTAEMVVREAREEE